MRASLLDFLLLTDLYEFPAGVRIGSEETKVLLLAISLPLLLGVPVILGHTDVLGELFVTQVILLLGGGNTFREARFEHFVGELVSFRVKLASKRIVGSSCGSSGLLALLSVSLSNDLRVSLEPLGGNLGLPLDELNGESGGLTASQNLIDNHFVLVTRVADLS